MTNKYQRGAILSPRHKLAAAMPASHFLAGVVPPANFGTIAHYQLGGNSQYGDCVSVSEANAKRAYSVALGNTEINIADNTVVSWARSHGYLNGADLSTVMTTMETAGMPDVSNVMHCDGSHSAVDYTNQAELKAAIYTCKSVKIAVAANQLENVVNGANGWFLFGARKDSSIDHCVELAGYGTAKYLAQLCGVTLPKGINPNEFSVLLVTWGTCGIVGWQSLQNIMVESEAWVRTPTDVVNPTHKYKETAMGDNVGTINIQDLIAILQNIDAVVQEIEKLLQPATDKPEGILPFNGTLLKELIAEIMAAAKNPALLSILASVAAGLPAPYNLIVEGIIAALQAANPTPAPTPVAA